jgi:hypothetical protein
MKIIDISQFSAEYVGENFKEICGNVLIEVLKKGDKYDPGFLYSDSQKSLLEEPVRIALSDITLDELVKLKDSLTLLINCIEVEPVKDIL